MDSILGREPDDNPDQSSSKPPHAGKPARPSALPVSPDKIPEELKAVGHWVVWSYVYSHGKQKWDKPPINVQTGAKASVQDPHTWVTFDKALRCYTKDGLDGIGYVLGAEDGRIGFDLDHCRDPDTGTINKWAMEIVRELNTYTEVSPSGTGLRLMAAGKLPSGGRKKNHVEMYDSGRYLTITGSHLDGTPTTIEARWGEIEALHTRVFGKVDAGVQRSTVHDLDAGYSVPPQPEDDAILAKVQAARNRHKFAQLWGGNCQRYSSASQADVALCCLLAFYTRDPRQLDRLFRRSGLYREKWDERRGERTYGASTIEAALRRQQESWRPPRRQKSQAWGSTERQQRPAIGTAPTNASASEITSREAITEVANDEATGRVMADDPNDASITPDEAMATAQKLLAALKDAPDARMVFQAMETLATLPITEWAGFKAECKAIMGKALNLNDLEQSRREVRRRLNQSAREVSRLISMPDRLPSVVITNRPLRDIAEESLQCWDVHNDPPQVFVRMGHLVRVRTDEHRRPILETLQEAHVRGALTRAANFVKLVKVEEGFEERHCSPPDDVVADILFRGAWPFPALEAVVEIPIVRPDGSILATPGYDPATKLYYYPAPDLNVPAIPTHPGRQQVDHAMQLIREAVSEFPYVYDGPEISQNGQGSRTSASAANTLAALFTIVARPLIDGCVPLALFDKPKAGTGASLLVKVITLIGTGRPAAMMVAPSKDDAEWRKSITSALIEGATVIVIDNVDQPLGEPSLAAALTTSIWEDRLLGRNQKVRLPQRATWFATGNNIRLSGDMPRRCYWIRMDAKMPRPWLRKTFTHKTLEKWVMVQRGPLLAALLTIIRAWHVAGRPPADIPTLGGFDSWASTIGSLLTFVGVPGFLGNLDALYEQSDDETPQWEAFFTVWWERFGDQPLPVATLVEECQKEGSPIRHALPEDLAAAMPGKQEKWGPFGRKLGIALRRQLEVRFGSEGLYLTRRRDSHKKQALWQLFRDVQEPLPPPHPVHLKADHTSLADTMRDVADVAVPPRSQDQSDPPPEPVKQREGIPEVLMEDQHPTLPAHPAPANHHAKTTIHAAGGQGVTSSTSDSGVEREVFEL